jgi:signal peptidase II
LTDQSAKSSFFRFVLIAAFAVIIDQVSKTFAARCLSPGPGIDVWGDFFRLTLVTNPGGVFGSRLGSQNFYTLVSILAIAATLWFFFKAKADGGLFRVGLSLVLGGAVGNLIDRFRFGQVIDFLDFDFFNISVPPAKLGIINFPGFHLDRWPVFNLADSFILIGMVLIVIHLLLTKEEKGPASSPVPQ